jgi:hypothetical protein
MKAAPAPGGPEESRRTAEQAAARLPRHPGPWRKRKAGAAGDPVCEDLVLDLDAFVTLHGLS